MIFCLGYELMFAPIYGSSYKEGNWDHRGQIVVGGKRIISFYMKSLVANIDRLYLFCDYVVFDFE